MNKLIDTYGRLHNYLRISVTDRCNLRCVYCMPSDGIELKPHSEILSFEEITKLAKLFAELGVTKIRITGGEPLVRKNLSSLILSLKKIEGIKNVGITTNGILLKNYVNDLKSAGLDGVNISLDTLSKDKFRRITLRDNFDDVLSGINTALHAGISPVKLNVVVMGGINDDEILDFVEFVKDKNLELRFIEYMPFKSNGWTNARFLPYSQMINLISSKYTLTPIENSESVAKNYTIKEFKGRIGFITSITEHFCSDCRRLRLTADGWLKTCLFFPAEKNLKELIRSNTSDSELKKVIVETLKQKKFMHPEIEELVNQENNSMIEIGG